MTSKEALKAFYEDTKNYNNDMRKYPAYYFDKPKNEEMLREWSVKQNEMYATILADLEILDILKGKMSIKCLSGHYIICDNLSSLSDNGNEKDFEKVKAWLERK